MRLACLASKFVLQFGEEAAEFRTELAVTVLSQSIDHTLRFFQDPVITVSDGTD